jgi:uncharacterized iron-regulated membrane protein
MNRSTINYLVDFVGLICFVLVSITGVILYHIPEGRRSGWEMFWGVTKHTWQDIHDYSGFLLIAVVAIHLLLHLTWIWCMTKNLFRR